MPNASWKNAIQSRAHKERSQPRKRKHLGLLEKHKDYVKRARDFNSKKRRLRALQARSITHSHPYTCAARAFADDEDWCFFRTRKRNYWRLSNSPRDDCETTN